MSKTVGGKYAGLVEQFERLDGMWADDANVSAGSPVQSYYKLAAEAIKSLEAELAEATKVKLDADGFGAMAKRYAACLWAAIGHSSTENERDHTVRLFRGAITEAGEQYRDQLKSLEAERDALLKVKRRLDDWFAIPGENGDFELVDYQAIMMDAGFMELDQ